MFAKQRLLVQTSLQTRTLLLSYFNRSSTDGNFGNAACGSV